jgi:hypothetical protein
MPRYCCLLIPVLGFVMAAAPEQAPGDLEHNRQLLRQWKTDPEHYARLQQDLRAFWGMPRAKQHRFRQLDRDFHQLDPKTRKRLWSVLERYRRWLEKLPEKDRRQIETASDSQERLRLIKEVRERQWIERQPREVRDRLRKLPADQRSIRVAQLREQERQQRHRGKGGGNVGGK